MSDITAYFQKIKESSNGWKASCPRCRHTGNTFSWSTEKNVGCCFNAACPWYYQRGGISHGRLSAFFNVSGIEETVPEVIQASETAEVKLPKEFRLIEDLHPSLGDKLFAYLE